MSKKAELRHASLRRLLAAAKEIAEIDGPAALAAALVESEQTVTNWGRRGVSGIGAMKAQAKFGCSANWVLTGAGPRLVQVDPHSQETPTAAESQATYTAVSFTQAIQVLAQALHTLHPSDRETAATLLSGMARNPEGQWADWFLALLERNPIPQSEDGGNPDRAGKHHKKSLPDNELAIENESKGLRFGPALTKAFSYGSEASERAGPAVPPAKKRSGAGS
jgi:hypothetical protein